MTDSEKSPAIVCRGLVVAYGDFIAVDNLDLDVNRGECFGLLGPNGAGKTTAVEAFEGLNTKRAGTILILGRPWHKNENKNRSLREKIGVTLQETWFPDKLTVWETLRLFVSFHKNRADITALSESMGIAHKRDARVGNLSGGERQRLALACALAGKPEILFLDEPTTGLDPNARHGIWTGVEGFVKEGGTVLLTTHYMEEAARLCHRVGIMDQGTIRSLGTPEELIRMLPAPSLVELAINGEIARKAAETLKGVRLAQTRGDGSVLFTDDPVKVLPGLLSFLAENGLSHTTVKTRDATLEDVFMHLTGKTLTSP
ncbi:MAG: ABC transporter ATP-binding protein [Deltaproteobacteria bacterium]|nr:ABC transporter ATP-binding protein [Deltaproteobacteria bacterium]